MKRVLQSLYVQVLLGVILGIAFGHFFPDAGGELKPLGDRFLPQDIRYPITDDLWIGSGGGHVWLHHVG